MLSVCRFGTQRLPSTLFSPGCCYTVGFYCMMSTSIKPLSSSSLMFNSSHFANWHRDRKQQCTSLGRKVGHSRRRSSQGCNALNPNSEVADPTRKVPQGSRGLCSPRLLAQRLKFGKQRFSPLIFAGSLSLQCDLEATV